MLARAERAAARVRAVTTWMFARRITTGSKASLEGEHSPTLPCL